MPNRLTGQNEFNFFCESEGDCTSERGAGQFSIFGAVEEKIATDFRGVTGMKQRVRG